MPAILHVAPKLPPHIPILQQEMSSSTSRPLGLLTFPTLLSLVIFSTLFVHLLNHARVFEQGAGHLSKRAPDSPYVTAGNKGDQWVCNLANAPPTTSQTKFTDYDQLEQNGWTDSGDHPAPNTLDELKELTVSCAHSHSRLRRLR